MYKEQVLFPIIRQVVKRPRVADVLFRFDKWGNPFCEEAYRDPWPLLAKLQADGPVAYHPMYQQWFVTGYEECRQILAASSETKTGEQIDILLHVRPYSKLSPRAKTLFSNFLLVTDPPDHTRLRKLVASTFTPRRINDLEPRVADIADAMIDEMRGDPVPDVAAAFNLRFPVAVISEMLGIPEELWPWARDFTSELVKLLDPFQGFDPAVVNDVVDDVWRVFGELADARRDDPRDDLFTALVEAEAEGDRLTHDELIIMSAFILAAGHETTAGMLGNALIALHDFPDQRERLRTEPDLWTNGIEELLRFDPSVKRDPRQVTTDLEVGDTTIPAGANVLLCIDGANRDPRRFDAPDELRLDRPDPRPLSFGHGIHYCIGAALARMELRVGLAKLLEEFGDYTIDADEVEWKPLTTLRGPSRLPIRRG